MTIGTSKREGTPDANLVFRAPDLTTVEVLRIAGQRVGLFNFGPGWNRRQGFFPALRHAGYAVSGRIRIRGSDGSEKTVTPGMRYAMAADDEAWVEGAEPFIGMEALAADRITDG